MFSAMSLETKSSPLTARDLEETLPMYEIHPKTYHALDTGVQLDAATPTNIANSIEFQFSDFVPYQLELDKCGLFPEFYFHFKRSFSNQSAENLAYCSRNLLEFTATYVGSEKDISSSVARVETDFDLKFRQCLHPELLNEFPGWTFTRNCVETQFREILEQRKDLASASIRLEKLNQQSRSEWQAGPLVDFLTAFGYSELSVWFHLVLVFGASAIDHPKNQESLKIAAQWQTEVGSLSRRTQAFVDQYKATAVITSVKQNQGNEKQKTIRYAIDRLFWVALFFFFFR